MELSIIRHALAEERTPDREDAARALTPEGRRAFGSCVAGMKRLKLRFDSLRHSPRLRAVQTANELCGLVSGETIVTNLLAVKPGAELLESLVGDHVALVGHEPWLSELIALLVVGDGARAPAFALKKGGMARLSGEPRPGGMALLGFFTPRVLRKLGE